MKLSPSVLAGALGLGVLSLVSPASAAGTVTAVVDPTTNALRITGDAADNDIEVTQEGGAYTVTGRNGTTVNEGASATFASARAVVLKMGDGADRVDLTGLVVSGDLRVQLEGGSDVLVLDDVRVQRNTAIRGGDGDDRVVAERCLFRRFLGVRTDRGNDTIEVRDSEMSDDSGFLSGSGDDTIVFDFCDFLDDMFVETRDGEDLLEAQDCVFEDDVDVDMGSGDDQVILDDSHFDKDVWLTGGSGHDDDLSVRSGTRFDRWPSFRSFED